MLLQESNKKINAHFDVSLRLGIYAMISIDWNQIDDREFVHLTADLLRRMGFVDLLVQGTGPDGALI